MSTASNDYVEPPRVELARLPTPIERIPSLTKELGVGFYVKRDDQTGAVLSGNKVRKLEYALARAMQRGAEVVLTCGGAQSNHCRATAIAARSLGLDVELFLRDPQSAAVEGNLFLDLLVGARVHGITPEQYADRDAIMAERAASLAEEGRVAEVIPEGASNALGSLGYARCVQEIVAWERSQGTVFDLVVAAVGSGGTLAGMLAGAALHGFGGRVVGVPVCHDAAHFRGVVDGILEEMREEFLPGLEVRVPEDGLLDGHVGLGYARASGEELERIRHVARSTGLVLDPVYTNKAFGGLLALVRDGAVGPGSNVLFIHTGGVFGLLPFARSMDLAP